MATDLRAIVLGLGDSGEAVTRLLLGEGAKVIVVDAADSPELQARRVAIERVGARVILRCTALPAGAWDLCVVSPGLPSDAPWVAEAERRGAEVVSELELAARRCACPLLAITGSNGKSTLVKLCVEALRTAGLRAEPAGNYGPPLSARVSESGALDWLVVEVSSFQLERVRQFHPRVGVLLNLQPNHLDRHGTFEAYASVKARLFDRMTAGDTAIVHQEALSRMQELTQGSPRWVSFGHGSKAQVRCRNGRVRWAPGPKGVADFQTTIFHNPVLELSAAAATAAMIACGVPPTAVVTAAEAFQPLPHRMEFIGCLRGVRYVNDSKATTLSALRAAVLMTPGIVRLIAGGLLKEEDLTIPCDVLAQRVRMVYLIGRDAERLFQAWNGRVPCRLCGSLEAAVQAAAAEAQAGDTVLLAPGCASFDQFRNFEERGHRFREAVGRIARQGGGS